MPDSERLCYSVSETASLLGLSKNSVLKGVMMGQIPHLRVGKRILIPRRSLHAWLESAGNGKPESFPELK